MPQQRGLTDPEHRTWLRIQRDKRNATTAALDTKEGDAKIASPGVGKSLSVMQTEVATGERTPRPGIHQKHIDRVVGGPQYGSLR